MNQAALFAQLQICLRSHRLRVTVARIEVFHAICRADAQALDRDALTLMVQRSSPDYSRAAINRALRDLERAGLIVSDRTQRNLCLFRVTPALGIGPGG